MNPAMTPETQSVCKQFYPHPADSHICSVCNRWDWEHEPVAEPASTGEPPPPSAKEFWNEYYKSDPNFPPSEAACDFAEAYASRTFWNQVNEIMGVFSPLATPASTARTDALAKLRADGWMVAVHNDYRINGKFHTFWLLTRVGREGQFVKGEGETDEDALAQIVRQLASHAAPGSVPQAETPK